MACWRPLGCSRSIPIPRKASMLISPLGPTEYDALKALVQGHSLTDVVEALETIGGETATHLRQLGDTAGAAKWDAAVVILDAAMTECNRLQL